MNLARRHTCRVSANSWSVSPGNPTITSVVNPALTTDVIVGFPGETDQEFAETLQVCRRARFMKIHIFPFSVRKGTPAADFPDQIHGTIRELRMLELER